jgi:tetratricopeptide (TPR) repeat protein
MSTTAPAPPDLDDDFDEYDEAPPPAPTTWRRFRSGGWIGAVSALPSLVAAVAAVVVLAAPRGNVEGRYRTLVFEALTAQQFHRASVGAERLLQISPFNPEYRFWLALAYDGLGDKEFAERLVNGIAPNDRAGYGPAHFWQADRLLRQEPLTAGAVREAEFHLRRVDPSQMNSEAVMRRMALVMLKTNRLDDARNFLVGADVASNPDLRIAYAEALLQRGRRDDGVRELAKAIDELRDRVNRLGKSSSDGGYARRFLAEALALKQDFPGAERVLDEGVVIGPPEQYARPLAQFYVKWLTAADLGTIQRPDVDAVESAIELLRKHHDGTLLSNGLLSFLYQRTGKLDEAAELLEGLASSNPDAAFDLVRVYTRLNRPEDAKKAAKSASGLLAKLVNENPADNGLRERLAEALLLLGEPAKAVAVLEERPRDRAGSKGLLARAYVAWWDGVNAKTATVAGAPLELLKRAIDADPWNPLVFSRLGSIRGPEANAARDMVAGLLTKGKAPPAAIHWILGNDAWSRGEKTLARTHMEQAYALAPKNPLVLNNLAWMSAFAEPSDLRRALRLADEGVTLAPNTVELRDTRGRLYAKAGDWPNALADLQRCLPAKKSDPEFLLILADVCERTGLRDVAGQYRKQADDLRPSKSVR